MLTEKYQKETKYLPVFAEQAKKLCAEHGYTDKKLADHFEVGRTTIHNWKKKIPEFKTAVQEGKDEYDTEMVEKAMLKAAKGGRATETTKELARNALASEIWKLVKNDADEALVQSFLKKIPEKLYITTKKVIKQIGANPTLAIWWTKNRDRMRWSEQSGGAELPEVRTFTPLQTEILKRQADTAIGEFMAQEKEEVSGVERRH